MYMQDLFDMKLFHQMVDEKMLNVRKHDDFDLFIANYSDQAQYKNCWNEVTLNCRGLIFEPLGKIVARPWKKFFNLGDAKAPYIGFSDLAEVTDKMDGSLGILYHHRGRPSISTRGSFHSQQAEWATKEISKYTRLEFWQCEYYTFLFEIIYPKNRIVVDYGDFAGLVILGAVQKTTGYALGPYEACALLNWPGIVAEVMPYRSINDVLAADDRENTEGYVIRAGNRMVKWKRPDYIELHRLISNLSEKSVWSGLEGGKTVEELIEGLPDEFHGFVRETSAKLLTAYNKRDGELVESFSSIYFNLPVGWTRKNFAMLVKDNPDKAYMFALLDYKDIEPMIWAELKPKGEDNRE